MAGPDDIFELDDDVHEPQYPSQDRSGGLAVRTSVPVYGHQRYYGKDDKQFLVVAKQAAPNGLAVSVPISIPAKLQRSASPDNSPSAYEFIPPHKLSQQSHSQLAQSLPLTSSAQLRTRDILMTATGMLPRQRSDGPSSRRGGLGPSAHGPVPEDSVSAPLQVQASQHRWDSYASASPSGGEQCPGEQYPGGLSMPGREFQSFLRRTTPLERYPRQFAIVPEGH